MRKKANLPLKKLGICSGVLGAFLVSLPVNPAYAGRYNASNGTGGNTSNATGGNTSNATGGKNSSRYGLARIQLRIRFKAAKLARQLEAAKASGNKAEVKQVSRQARRFLKSIPRNRYRTSGFYRRSW